MKRLLRDPAFLVLPLALFLLVFYLLPVVQMLLRSTGADWSFRPFVDAFSSEVTLKVFWLTARIAVIVTVLTLALAYPLAYFIATTGERTAMVLLALVLVPFWTSILIRSYAWMVLLGQNGVVNGFLRWTGVIDAPVRMLNTTFAVYVGMVHVLLPFMVLPILSSLKAIDGRLVAAAENLGAGPGAVFRHVIVPLSMPGVLAGSVLVFVLSLGFYITPALVGGPSDMTVSMLIAGEVDLYRWDVASAIATALLIVTLVTLALFGRVVSLERIFGGAR
ncbi:ABC transporter permease [Paenirhodobacter populi]|uniref:ABC transporter permease n=1 Tax=Paenirhodobacter populi TaxID=2306993 RepID=A0A443K6L9_9RHOB|nr:ABC transporter permease [Sinirhodobacter populi]RWR05361.1 ABC transporter permease [Sinirhodobacter populi]RWR28385.1 ABC transporter permease [Sinirhodobacter populi]